MSVTAWTAARRNDALYAVLGVLAGVGCGVAFAHSTQLGVAFVGAVALSLLVIARPVSLGIVALAGVYASPRLGGASSGPAGATGISYTDALLIAATVIALPLLFGGAELRRLRLVLLGLGAYLACLLPGVVLNYAHRTVFEWGHRVFLVGGALVVGAWIARELAVRTALRGLFVVSAVVAAAAVVDAVGRGFTPAFPLGLNKNFAGALLGTVIVVALVAPQAAQLGRRVLMLLVLLLAGGLLATQSRGALLAVAAGLLVAFYLDPRSHGRTARAGMLLITLVFGGFVLVSVHDELGQTKAELNNSSIGVRRNVERVTRDIWRISPVYGVGLKYFNTGAFGPLAQPANNVVDNELAESGVIGLAGFVVLQGAAAAAGIRRRRDGAMIVTGTSCVLVTLLHGMVDIYWTAGTVTLPFLILGMALGAPPPDEPGGGSAAFGLAEQSTDEVLAQDSLSRS